MNTENLKIKPITSITILSFIHICSSPEGMSWVRVGDRGIEFLNTQKIKEPFSVRLGFKKCVRIGKYVIVTFRD